MAGLDESGRPKAVRWENDELYLLDQTRLPVEVVIERQDTVEQVWNSIKQLKVRGAPAIGVAGAYGLVVAMLHERVSGRDAFLAALEQHACYLDSSRPTAVNLRWALERVVNTAKRSDAASAPSLLKVITDEAVAIHREDEELCRLIGEHGVDLISEGAGLLTHCNAGRLATSEYGTATAPMYLAHKRGVRFRIYADETRPLLQGARLTSWELQQAGLDVTLIADTMTAYVMDAGLIDLVIVGTDRVAANGDVANKIGTLGVAILARHFGIPFYVALPFSTIDFNTPTGAEIVIEERDPDEVRSFGRRPTAPPDVKVRNPAFDVTPHHLVSGFITDRGMVGPPFAENLRKLYVTEV